MTEARRFKGDDIRPFGLACDDSFIGDGFVGIAGESGMEYPGGSFDVESGPTIVDLVVELKLKTEIAIPDTLPVVPPLA